MNVSLASELSIVAFTEAGKRLASTLEEKLQQFDAQVEVLYKPKPFTETVQQAFKDGKALIMICASGIVVRTLAPVIQSKLQDPPVLVLDEMGRYVIPLLSGHEGGANDLADKVASLIDAQLVATTANPYLNPVYTVGMGCERNCPVEELDKLLQSCLAQAGINVDQLQSINSIAIKHDEVGLIELAKQHDKPYRVFSVEQLTEMDPLLKHRSEYVYKTVGVYGVAESAALFAVQQIVQSELQPELILAKQKTNKATCAIARSYLDKAKN
ncbi:MAG: cobalamin biosynthesis protein CbiG [Pseudomonadales bacterium]|nr:cobalamin biosynthesis protein CbiG [Pseudomonadales bacterium]